MMETWLPHKLRVLRVRQGLTLIDAAKKTGVTRATLSELERGHRHPVAPTLVKIAEGYGVPVEELLEEPSPLASASSASPSPEDAEAGQPDEAPEAPEEEDRRITPVSPSFLEEQASFIKGLKEEREAEIEAVKQETDSPSPYWIFHLEADDKYLEIIYQEIVAFVEAVKAGRELAEAPVRLACIEFSRELSDFLQLTDKARALAGGADVNTRLEAVQGMPEIERHAHSTSPGQRG